MSSKRSLADSVTESTESPSQHQPAKRTRLSGEQDLLDGLYKTIVTVYVGPHSDAFQIYKELLCHNSPFFKAALEGSFKEGDEQTVSLPEDDVKTFKIYLTWLNTTQLRYNFDDVEWWLCFAQLWVFADKIGSTSLKNKTIDAICATIKQNRDLAWASPHAVCYTFDNTSSDCLLRHLVVLHAYHNPVRNMSSVSNLEHYPVAFLSRLTSILFRNPQKWDSEGKFNNSVKLNFEATRYHIECSDTCCSETSNKKPEV